MEFDLRQRALPVAFSQLHKIKKALQQMLEGFFVFPFQKWYQCEIETLPDRI